MVNREGGRERVNYSASHLWPISCKSPGKKKNVLGITKEISIQLCVYRWDFVQQEGQAGVSMEVYLELRVDLLCLRESVGTSNGFKRLPCLLWLYTQRVEQGSQGLTLTRATRFKDALWNGKQHWGFSTSAVLLSYRPLVQQLLICQDFKMCSCQKRDSKMGQRSNLNAP